MTNYYENLDAILTEYRISFLNAYKAGLFVLAAKFLFDRNSAHPPQAWLDDMPPFVSRSTSIRSQLMIEDKAKAYCDYWNPRLEASMALFRQQNQDKYGKV